MALLGSVLEVAWLSSQCLAYEDVLRASFKIVLFVPTFIKKLHKNIFFGMTGKK